MIKVLVNNTANPVFVEDTGCYVPVEGYTIPQQDYLLWASSSDAVTLIGAETLSVNDGSSDLSISDGVDLIKGYFPRKIVGGTDGTVIGNSTDRLKTIDQDIIDALYAIAAGQTTATNPIQFTTIRTTDYKNPKWSCRPAVGEQLEVARLTIPANKKWFITSWDGSANLRGKYEMLEVIAPSTATLYDGCESTSGWIVTDLSSLATSSDESQGTYSLTASLATQGSSRQTGYFEKGSLSLDWSSHSYIALDVKRSSGTDVNVYLRLYNGTNYHTFGAVQVNQVWSQVRFDLSQSTIDLSAVSKIRVYFTEKNATKVGPTNVFVDNIRTMSSEELWVVDQFFADTRIPYQNLFPTNLPYEEGDILVFRVTNEDSAVGDFEIGLNGREVDIS